MEDCCKNDLGLKPHNEDVDLGIQADQEGIYVFILSFAGIKISRKVTLELGADIVIPRPFNESYLYKAQVKQPDGEFLSLNDCTNFEFRTYVSADRVCENECEEDPEPDPYY